MKNEVKISLAWGGLWKGKLAKELVCKPPLSSIAMAVDQTGISVSGFILETMKTLTLKIDGEIVPDDEKEAFWKTVKSRDAERAFLRCLQAIWTGSCTEVPQDVICAKSHTSEIIVDLTQVEEYENVSDSFTVDLIEPFKVDETEIKTIEGSVPTLEQSFTIEPIVNEKPVEGTFKLLAMTCKPKGGGRRFSLADIMRLPARDRKKLENEVMKKHRLVNLDIVSRCPICGSRASGRINLTDFI